MPANSVDYAADETKAAVNSAAEAATKASADAQRSFAEAAKRLERAVSEGIEQIRAQTRAYTDTAGEQLDQAQRDTMLEVMPPPAAEAWRTVGIESYKKSVAALVG